MMRPRLQEALTHATTTHNQRALSTLRLILTALKDRDISARSRGQEEGIDEDEIIAMLESMIAQRRQSIALYEQEGRVDLIEEERDEIDIITHLMPKMLDEQETRTAVETVITEIGALSVKDVGRIMAELRHRYPNEMRFNLACDIVKQSLANKSSSPMSSYYQEQNIS